MVVCLFCFLLLFGGAVGVFSAAYFYLGHAGLVLLLDAACVMVFGCNFL
jgi:hypothetical protein